MRLLSLFQLKALHYFLFIGILLVVMPMSEAQKKKKKKRGKKEKQDKKNKTGKDGLTKKESKEWKSRLKKLRPAQYKVLMDEYYNLKEQLAETESNIAEYEAQIGEQEKALERFKEETGQLRKQLAAKPKVVKTVAAAPTVAKGVVYRIQVGAYEGIDLQRHSAQQNFNVENAGGTQKFTIGEFREYRAADDLKKYLQKMGVSDAWIVSYKDGQRVDISEAKGGR